MGKEIMKDELLVLSASRRTDLVACYPDFLAQRLRDFPPATVHTLVLWTKDPRNIIVPGPLRDVLAGYRQLYVHYTITGMGGGEFEPGVPAWKESVALMSELIDLIGGPLRMSWRFDPILQVEGQGRSWSNLELFPLLAEAVAFYGIRSCRVSWAAPYRKVSARLGRSGWRLVEQGPEERSGQASRLGEVARRHRIALAYCAMEGLPGSRCIDGELLSRLHPDGLSCSRQRAKGQRRLCGCTESLDIGWYSLACKKGCLYCYACP